MDQQTKLIVVSVVGGMVVMGVSLFLWSSLREMRSTAARRFGLRTRRKPEAENDHRFVSARISVPDLTPVAIHGVRPDDVAVGSKYMLTQSQVQQIVDRANRLGELREDQALDELLAELRVTPRTSAPKSEASP